MSEDATEISDTPRGRWDFTEGQRIVIGFLLWLNILVLVVLYLAFTGQLAL
jgi:hypothetical protein